MKPIHLGRTLALAGLCAGLAACETISGWFPDKQKQYKYSTEIPPLEIPPDLTSSTIEDATTRKLSEPTPDETARSRPGEEPAPEAERPEEAEPPRPVAKRTQSPEVDSTLAQSSDNVPLIEIEATFDRAWSDVAKALGRLELEVTDQNRSEGMYFVYYGGDQKPYEDRGFFGDVAALFGGGQEKSREYRVKLEGKDQVTLLYVLDSDGKPQDSGPGFDLLKRLHETLKTLAEPPPKAGEKPAE
ncbi:Beta-barrel assembly machine subunit BamC [Methylomagnum ishizawai]|uniref:Beta-barrel assembly machine subunit BamC n=1 Tax=Methylomagnum ishizawai TaxID=1760988 RepID=A0A1Y6D053_9GAMM|nr:outer membrane protein assembly factor BamC [Methylomagnum ishizawai]SMF94203.1 Beta-barrel assembly machine subunit BamC [Methylomagnum ishizawai]